MCRGKRPKPAGTGRLKTPEAVEGRKHIDIQTDAYLEELTGRCAACMMQGAASFENHTSPSSTTNHPLLSDTVPEVDNNTQTDAFLDRPPTPLFVPQKTGLDATTQIENGDLFDFDFEVEPILEVREAAARGFCSGRPPVPVRASLCSV